VFSNDSLIINYNVGGLSDLCCSSAGWDNLAEMLIIVHFKEGTFFSGKVARILILNFAKDLSLL